MMVIGVVISFCLTSPNTLTEENRVEKVSIPYKPIKIIREKDGFKIYDVLDGGLLQDYKTGKIVMRGSYDY